MNAQQIDLRERRSQQQGTRVRGSGGSGGKPPRGAIAAATVVAVAVILIAAVSISPGTQPVASEAPVSSSGGVERVEVLPSPIPPQSQTEAALPAPGASFGAAGISVNFIDPRDALGSFRQIVIGNAYPPLLDGLQILDEGSELNRHWVGFWNAFNAEGLGAKGQLLSEASWLRDEAATGNELASWLLEDVRLGLKEAADAGSGVSVLGATWIAKSILALDALGFPEDAWALQNAAERSLESAVKAFNEQEAAAAPSAGTDPESAPQSQLEVQPQPQPGAYQKSWAEEVTAPDYDLNEWNNTTPKILNGMPVGTGEYALGISPRYILISFRQVYDFLKGQPVNEVWVLTHIKHGVRRDVPVLEVTFRLSDFTFSQFGENGEVTASFVMTVLWQSYPPFQVGDELHTGNLITFTLKNLQGWGEDE